MKKNLAKKGILSILTGTMLMSSSVVWADVGVTYMGTNIQELQNRGSVASSNSFAVGINADAITNANYAIAIGANQPGDGEDSTRTTAMGNYSIAVGYNATAGASNGNSGIAIGGSSIAGGDGSIAIGKNANAMSGKQGGVALGDNTSVAGANSVAIGYGSQVDSGVSNVVSVGSGNANDSYGTRSIINVSDVSDWQDTVSNGSYAVNVNTLNVALSGYVKKETTNGTTTTQISSTFTVEETESGGSESTKVTINGNDANNPIVMDGEGITVGKNSTRMDGTGFYVWADNNSSNNNTTHDPDQAIASINDNGEIKAANGAFNVNESGNVTANGFAIKDVNGNSSDIKDIFAAKATTLAGYGITDAYTKTETNTELDKKADKATTLEGYGITDAYTKTEIDEKLGGSNASVAGLNQRLDKTNTKINKVGAGAAALAALHPLEYDPDDKLTFSAGMGNYAGENAAALGAFYRPNEKFMLSLGGTMGNGENMVNLGLSIGLDKPNSYAKLSKRELIQEVNAVKAENNILVKKVDAVEAENEAMKAEMAEMKAMLQELLAKK